MEEQQYNATDIEAFVARFYQGRSMSIVPYGYNLTFLALAQNGVATQTLNITANADFMLLALRHRANISAAQQTATKTAPFVRCLITDSGSNEQFTNAAVDLENYSSNGQGVSRDLRYPRIISGRSTLTVQMTNFAPTAETYAVLDLFLEGVLIRAYQG